MKGETLTTAHFLAGQVRFVLLSSEKSCHTLSPIPHTYVQREVDFVDVPLRAPFCYTTDTQEDPHPF